MMEIIKPILKYFWKLTLWGFLAVFFFYACVGKKVYVGKDANGNDKYAYDCKSDPGDINYPGVDDWCGETYSVSSKGTSCYDSDDASANPPRTATGP